MIKADLVRCVSNRTGLTKSQAQTAVNTILDMMKGSMMRGERIELRGFGVFSTKPRKTGVGRNPRTGEEVLIPPGRTVRFKPGKQMLGEGDGRSAIEQYRVRRPSRLSVYEKA